MKQPERVKRPARRPEIGILTAAAVSLLVVASIFVIGEAYLSKVTLNLDQRGALLNTLLICDIIVFCASALATVLLSYFSSVSYGSRESRSLMSSKALPLYGILMLLPIIFVACDLAFKPLFFAQFEVEIALAMSVIGIISLIPFSVNVLDHIKPAGAIDSLISRVEEEFMGSGFDYPAESMAMQRPSLRGASGMGLMSLLKELWESGDSEPVMGALGRMEDIALSVKAPFNDPKRVSMASGMVSLMARAGSESARDEHYEVTYRAVDGLCEISGASGHKGISSLAFRSICSIHTFCSTCLDEQALAGLEVKLMEAYAALYDRTGRREVLELAASTAGKATASRMFAMEEYDGILYAAGAVYRRVAELDESEEYANKALTLLYEALTARTSEAAPADHACIKGEIGRAYMALAKAKNPVKSYKNAASAFEDAGKLMLPQVAPWDAAMYRSKAACAYTRLAEEYCKSKRYDDALGAARSALTLYAEATKFFEKRSAEEHADLMSNLGLTHTIISEVYLKSRMFDQSVKHASLALDAYSSAAEVTDAVSMPEQYASTKTSLGLTYVNMAEIHFREKRYENAITACDRAIAAYNEAIRIFDDKGKEKPAAIARKNLKKANDLFNTMMRVGVVERERKPLAVEQ